VLVTGPDFGIGSSREHAVWALLGAGVRASRVPTRDEVETAA
jgi:3-isopropylmalate/(R)-2-methylmalate dehydratase small subunit